MIKIACVNEKLKNIQENIWNFVISENDTDEFYIDLTKMIITVDILFNNSLFIHLMDNVQEKN